jgi:hypothetical protein
MRRDIKYQCAAIQHDLLSLLKAPSSLGMVPVSWLLARTMLVRDLRDPISEIRLPERPFFSSLSAMSQIKVFIKGAKNEMKTQTHTRLVMHLLIKNRNELT